MERCTCVNCPEHGTKAKAEKERRAEEHTRPSEQPCRCGGENWNSGSTCGSCGGYIVWRNGW